MGKHSKEKNTSGLKIVISVILIIIIIIGISFGRLKIKDGRQENQEYNKSTQTIVNKKLVIKSNSDYNKKIEYNFENNILKTVKIYEQFEVKEKFEAQKATYEIIENIEVIDINEEEFSIQIEKKDFGSDAGKSYEEIYDKYLVQIIGAYQIIQ